MRRGPPVPFRRLCHDVEADDSPDARRVFLGRADSIRLRYTLAGARPGAVSDRAERHVELWTVLSWEALC